MTPGLPERLLTAKEAAQYLNVHVNTLKRWNVPHYVVCRRGDRRYSRQDLDAYLRKWMDGG